MDYKLKKLYLYYLNNFDKIKDIITNKSAFIKNIAFLSEHISLLKRCIELNLLKDDFSFDDIFKIYLQKPELSLFKDYNMINYTNSYPQQNKRDEFIPFDNDNSDHSYFLQRDFDGFKILFFNHFSNNITIKNEIFNIEKYNTTKKILRMFNSSKHNFILYNNGVITPSYFLFFDRGNVLFNRNIEYKDNCISVDMPNISFKFKNLKYYLKLVDFYSNDFLNTSKKFIFFKQEYSIKKEDSISINNIDTLFSDWSIVKDQLSFSSFKKFKSSFFSSSIFYKNAVFIDKYPCLFLKYKNIMLHRKVFFNDNKNENNKFIKIISVNNQDNVFKIKNDILTDSSLPILNLYFSFFEENSALFDKKRNDILKNLKKHIKQNEDLNKIEKQLFLLYRK